MFLFLHPAVRRVSIRSTTRKLCLISCFTGHPQLEHETRHGSMAQTVWTIEGGDDEPLEVQGHKYATGDSGKKTTRSYSLF